MTPTKWIQQMNAIGIVVKSGAGRKFILVTGRSQEDQSRDAYGPPRGLRSLFFWVFYSGSLRVFLVWLQRTPGEVLHREYRGCAWGIWNGRYQACICSSWCRTSTWRRRSTPFPTEPLPGIASTRNTNAANCSLHRTRPSAFLIVVQATYMQGSR